MVDKLSVDARSLERLRHRCLVLQEQALLTYTRGLILYIPAS